MAFNQFPGGGRYEELNAPGARVLVYSQRNVAHLPFHVTQYEFEDTIAQMDRVRLLAPHAPPTPSGLRLAARFARNRVRRALGGYFVPGVQPTTVEGEYDLFFANFHFPDQLAHLDHLAGWRERCRTAVAFLIEMWPPDIERYARYLPLLDQFDHVFMLNRGTIAELSRRTSAPLAFLPTAVDCERFVPWPALPERSIDCYSYGRRSPATHRALMELMARGELTYVADTMRGAMIDFREHRLLVSRLLQRSRYFFAYRVNDNAYRAERTGGDEGLSTRYFEASAAGAVLLGSRPRCPEYDECFDWPDATIEIPFDATNIAEILAELDADPERLARIRLHGMVNALRRHDWLYRWRQVLAVAGLPETPAMRARGEWLEQTARQIELQLGGGLDGVSIAVS